MRYIPKTALNTTAEKVLNLSNSPNTAFGNKDVPIGPISIATRQKIAQILSEFICSFLAPIAIKTRDASDNTTTKTVTIRCITFCGFDTGASLTHGKRLYPTLQIHSMAVKK